MAVQNSKAYFKRKNAERRAECKRKRICVDCKEKIEKYKRRTRCFDCRMIASAKGLERYRPNRKILAFAA